MSSLISHENIIKILGVYVESNYIHFIMEHAEEDFLQRLTRERRTPLTSKLRSKKYWLNILLQIASGINYLHSLNICQKNFSYHNILIRQNTAALSDSTISLNDDGSEDITHGDVVNYPWESPEIFEYNRYCLESDIYSFAIVMYQVFTGNAIVYKGMVGSQIVLKVCMGMRPKIPEIYSQCNFSIAYFNLMQSCWAQDRQRRPSMSAIINELSKLLSLI
jgi:serine/threonine protein kinase